LICWFFPAGPGCAMDVSSDSDDSDVNVPSQGTDNDCMRAFAANSELKPFSLKDHMDPGKLIVGRVTTEILGREGHPKILRYNMKQLVKYTALGTLFSNGTVFTMDRTALTNVVVLFLVMMVITAIFYLANLSDLKQLQTLNLKSLTQLTNSTNQFVPFLLAYYVALSLNRWWALRVSALGKVLDALANVCMLVSCELSDRKWMDLRNQVAKYGIASIELLVQAARGTENFEELVQNDLLSFAEVEAVRRKTYEYQRPMMMWAWIVRICVGALDHNKSPPAVAQQVITHCVNAREGIATINSYLDTQLPFAYVHLITFLVNIQNFVFALLSGVTVAQNFATKNVTGIIQQTISCTLVVLIYQSLLQITYHILTPFGDDVLDFPIKAYTNYIATMIDAFFEAQQPCPVVAEDGTLKRPREKKKKKRDPGQDSNVF